MRIRVNEYDRMEPARAFGDRSRFGGARTGGALVIMVPYGLKKGIPKTT